MPASQIIGFSPVTLGEGIKAGTRRALCPLNTLNAVGLNQENYSALQVGIAGTFDRAFAHVPINTLDGLSNLTVRRGGSNQSLSLAYPAGQTGGLLVEGPGVAFPAASDLTWGLDTRLAATGAIDPHLVALRFLPDDPAATVWWAWTGGSGGGFGTPSVTRFASISGTVGFQASETYAAARIHGAFVSTRLAVEVAKNPRTTPTILRTRVNGVDGGQVLTIPAGAIGRFMAPLGQFDVLAPGDTYDYSITTGAGTGTFNIRWISTLLVSANRQWIYPCTNVNAATIWSADGPRYVPFAGNLANMHPLEAVTQVPLFPQRVSKLSCYVSANNAVTATDVSVRLDGGAGLCTVSIPPGEIGWFENLVDRDDIADGTLGNLEIAPGGGAGRLIFRTVTLRGETEALGSAGVPGPISFRRGV